MVTSADDSSFPPVTNRRAGTLYVLMAYVARAGQRILILRKAVALFRELKAFVASTSYTASISSASKRLCTAWMPASLPLL